MKIQNDNAAFLFIFIHAMANFIYLCDKKDCS